jgi:hypothetical protein
MLHGIPGRLTVDFERVNSQALEFHGRPPFPGATHLPPFFIRPCPTGDDAPNYGGSFESVTRQ